MGQADTDGRLRCGAKTEEGGFCQRFPMANASVCHQHGGLEPTGAEKRASRENAITHGLFVDRFLSDEERALYASVASGEVSLGRVQWELLAALVVRTNRLMRWEGLEKEGVSPGSVTSVFRLMLKMLSDLDWENVGTDEEVALDVAEVHDVVNEVFAEDPELVVSHCPREVQEDVRDAMGIEDPYASTNG